MKHSSSLLAIVAGPCLIAQTLQFEVASLRPTPPEVSNNDRVNIGLHLDGQQARIGSFSIKDYIAMAYEVAQNRIQGPDFIGSDRYDLNATLPPGSKTDQIPQMVQVLLTERFKLKFHREKKEMRVYVLGRGTKPLGLKPAVVDPAATNGTVAVAATGSGQGVSVDLGGGASYTFANNRFEGKKLDMVTLADSLALYLDLPLVNETGLEGFYDVSFEMAPEDYRAMLLRAAMVNGIVLPPQLQQFVNTATTPTLYEGLDKLGLKLDTRRMEMDVIIVDDIAKAPTEN